MSVLPDDVVPLVPVAVEVDPETPLPVVPFRLPALVPSLLGLPLRLVCAPCVPDDVLLDVCPAVSLLAVAFDSIQPLAFEVDVDRLADALCDALAVCITHPVTVII